MKKKQEQLTKQANIIGELRGKIHQLEIETEIKNTDKVNDEEVINLKLTLEAARRRIFTLEKKHFTLQKKTQE